MRNLLIILCFGLLQWSCSSTIYVVRHAEKIDESTDPGLSSLGQQRAQVLANLLQPKNIQCIYTTKFQRTIQTAKPLSLNTKVPIQVYNDLDSLANVLRMSSKNTLVVGHSNTVLPLLVKFGVTPALQTIDSKDYDNLFILHLKGKKAVLEERTYGVKTP